MVSFLLSTNAITEGWIEFGNHLGKCVCTVEPNAVHGSTEIRIPHPESEKGIIWQGGDQIANLE